MVHESTGKDIATAGTGQMFYFTTIEIKMKRSKMSISPPPQDAITSDITCNTQTHLHSCTRKLYA